MTAHRELPGAFHIEDHLASARQTRQKLPLRGFFVVALRGYVPLC